MNLKTLELPNSLKEIGCSAFYKSGIEELKIPDSVENIGPDCFSKCVNLKTIELSEKMSVLPSNRDTAIEKIKNENSVYLRHGVWNKYQLCKVTDAIESIKNSGYGADIYYDEDNKMYYVSIPCDSDMW